MIYLDNSATTYPKPSAVAAAVSSTIKASANPGRSGHSMSLAAAEKIYAARRTAADFFSAADETRVIFTPGCTFGLNAAIKGLLSPGDHVVVSNLEHNAVMRPLETLRAKGIDITKAEAFAADDEKTVDSFRHSINAKTKMIICTHASNVWGIRFPIERLCALAHAYGLIFITDAAQSAGIVPISMNDGYDIVCTAGHKGLYGPMGTGIMLLSENIMPATIIEGGTGSNSVSLLQPEDLPDRYESGTPNLPGIAGLKAGIDFIRSKGTESVAQHEFRLIGELYRAFEKLPNIRLYTPFPDPEHFVPVLSFNVEGYDSEDIAAFLNNHGIAVRAGLHCAPSAHEAFGTLSTGAVRISPSVFTRHSDIERLVFTIKKLK
ncbi:MAG: aminotransferase class V-fold PLP-dependent enzyme [Clostridia bacterium]|nr:aminotransferase class V-fold PLP-dependent enzyme [Clostridia bacterium]